MKRTFYRQAPIMAKLIFIGLAAGFANGLLGAGGGTIIVFGIASVLGESMKNGNDVFATALCVMLPVSAVSCVFYALRGHINTEGFGYFALPAIIGGAVGGLLLGKVKAGWVKKLFAVLVVISGILLIIR